MTAELEVEPLSIAGRYALYDVIATGGMATVHIGRLRGAIGFTRTVAIKRLHPQFARDAEFVSMFVDEARLAARIRHPNVAQTLDIVAANSELFLIMEYIHGESLSRLMRLARARNETVPLGVVNAIMAGALHGLHAAHETTDERGRSLELVHRDVSPQNILVATDGLARVLDFGIARAAGTVHTSQVGKLKGKLAYIAPEQAENGAVARQADIYSASVVLWELLTGKRLFQGDNPRAVIARVLSEKIAPPSQVVADLPPAYDAVVMKGLARDPAQRYATAQDMARALDACGKAESLAGVAAWVESIAGDMLEERAARVARSERSSEGRHVSELRALVDELASGARHESSEAAASLLPITASQPAGGSGRAADEVAQTHDGFSGSAAGLPRQKRRRARTLGVLAIGVALSVAAGVAYVTRRESAPGASLESKAAEAEPPGVRAAAVATEARPKAPPNVGASDAGAASHAVDASAAVAESVSAAPAAPRSPAARRPSKRATDQPAGKTSPFSNLGGRL